MPIADDFRLKLDDRILPQFTPDVRRRQVDACETKLPIFLDLNVASVDYALKLIGGLALDETAFLVVPEDQRNSAIKLAKEFQLAAIMIPPEVMPNPYSWALVTAKGSVFSNPVL